MVYTHSTGVLRVLSYLEFPWSSLYAFIWVPKFIRDFCYGMVASNRYALFGKKSDGACPYNPGIRKKCIDWGEECDLDREEDDENANDNSYLSKEV